MLPTTIRSPPSTGDYTPLAEYQSQTPESFVDGKPVLHLSLTAVKATIPKSHCGQLAIFPSDLPVSNDDQSNGDAGAEPTVEREVDVYVNSENLTIFSQQAEAGVSIPYPSISIHAVKQVPTPADNNNGSSQALWMQLDFSDGGSDDETFNTVELTLIPASSTLASTDEADTNSPSSSPASQMYEAIAACSNLHPDPNDDGDDDEDEYDRIVFEGSEEHEAIEGFSGVLRGAADGGLPPPMPGSGGWITAENVHEYFDEDGNWIRGTEGGEEEALGEGAGRTRAREEVDADADGINGHADGDNAENKRPRVD